MGAPSLNVAIQGLGVISADNANTFVQSCDNFDQLRSFTGVGGVQVYARGGTTSNDGLQGDFYWNTTSVSADDGGITTLAPYGATSAIPGRWSRINAFVSSGISGGVLYFSSTTSVTSSALLKAYALVLGGGGGLPPATLPTLGTSSQVLIGNAGGAPSWGSVNLATMTTGLLPGSALTYAAGSDVLAGTSSTLVVSPAALVAANAFLPLTYNASIIWGMASGRNASVTLTGNTTFGTPTGAQVGQTYNLLITQDSNGSRTVSWNAVFDWGAAGAPTLTTTAGKTDMITLVCVSAAPLFYCYINKGF